MSVSLSGGKLKEIIADPGLRQEADDGLPRSVLAAARFDAKEGTAFAPMMINHLENLGYLILISDASLQDVEIVTFYAYFGRLRAIIRDKEISKSGPDQEWAST